MLFYVLIDVYVQVSRPFLYSGARTNWDTLKLGHGARTNWDTLKLGHGARTNWDTLKSGHFEMGPSQ